MLGAVRKVNSNTTAADRAKCAQAPREKLTSSANASTPNNNRCRSRTAGLMIVCSSMTSGSTRNGPNTFGSLKVAARTVVQRGVGEVTEIAGNADQRGEEGGDEIGPPQDDQPPQAVLAEEAGINDSGHGKIKGDSHIDGCVAAAGLLARQNQRQQTAEIEDQQQDDQRQQLAVEPDTCDEAGQRKQRAGGFVRRWLDEDERTDQDREEQRAMQQGCRRRRRSPGHARARHTDRLPI